MSLFNDVQHPAFICLLSVLCNTAHALFCRDAAPTSQWPPPPLHSSTGHRPAPPSPPWRLLSSTANPKVLDANPVHIKALYHRGMSCMLGGDFDDAKNDFEKMIVVDKSSEPDTTASLLKLKQKEQETKKEARKQLKGLFDKKPGEISEVGVESEDAKNASDTVDSGEAVTNANRDADAKAGPDAEPGYAFQQERPGLLGRIWPSAKRILSSLGLNRTLHRGCLPP